MKVIDTVKPRSQNQMIEGARALNWALAKLGCAVHPSISVKQFSRAYQVKVRIV